MKKPEKVSNANKEYFKDGIPDWDEREEEFNEALDEDIDNEEVVKSESPINKDFKSGINLDKNKLNRDNLNIDEKEKLYVSDPTKDAIGATDYKMDTMDRSQD